MSTDIFFFIISLTNFESCAFLKALVTLTPCFVSHYVSVASVAADAGALSIHLQVDAVIQL
jgi:hypothetical protein